MSTRGNKAQIAQQLGEGHLLVWVALEQARLELEHLQLITINHENYGEMQDILTLMQVNLDSLQYIELILLYNPFPISPGRE